MTGCSSHARLPACFRPPRLGLQKFLALAACVSAAWAFCGCGRGQQAAALEEPRSSATRVPITFAYWAVNVREVVLVRNLKRRFEAANPDVSVRLLEISQRYYEKLQTMMAAGEPPDVFSANYGRLADYIRAGVVRDLRHFSRDDEALANKYAPVAWNSLKKLSSAVGKPGLWGVPRDWSPAGLLFYNRDILRAAGVGEPASVWSWRDFRQACERVKAAGLPNVTPTALNLYPYSVFTWLAQADGPVLTPQGEVLPRPERTAEAIGFILGLWRDGLSSRPDPNHDASIEQFAAGRTAFVFGTFYTLQTCANIRDFDWGVAPPLKHHRHACSALPTFLAVSAASQNPAAALRWAMFLSTEAARQYAEANLALPCVQPELFVDIFLSRPPLDRTRKAVFEAVSISEPPPVHRSLSYERLVDEVRRGLEAAILDQTDAGGAVEQIRRRLAQASARASEENTKTLRNAAPN